MNSADHTREARNGHRVFVGKYLGRNTETGEERKL
jgi:hypothetical protein